MIGGLAAFVGGSHGSQHGIRRIGGATKATSLPSLATNSGSMPSSSQAPFTGVANRDRAGIDLDPDAGGRGDLAKRSAQAPAGGIAQDVDFARRQHRRDQP